MAPDTKNKAGIKREVATTEAGYEPGFEPMSPAGSVKVLDFEFRSGPTQVGNTSGISPSRSLQVATDIHWRGVLSQANRTLGELAEKGHGHAPHLAHTAHAMDRFLRFVNSGDTESAIRALVIATLELEKAELITEGS